MKTNIKCIDDLTAQRYIDGELTDSERIRINQHLLLCQACSGKIQKQTEWADEVKWSLRNSSVDSTNIPEFRISARQLKTRINADLLRPLLKIAAIIAVILGGTFLLTKEQTPVYQPSAEDIELWMEATSGNDANYDWHHRQIGCPVTESFVHPENTTIN